MQALSYFFDEAWASLRRGLRTALLATVTIAVAFAVLGGFLILTRNMEGVFARWQEAAEFSVYLTDTATDAQRAAIERTVRGSAVVSSLEIVTKEEALRRFKEHFAALADAASELPANPLPASFEIRLRPNAAPADVEALARQTAALGGVADVRYDRQWIERLIRAAGIVRTGGLTLATFLVGAAVLTVASVVRLALVARREEIHIMQLVGAPIAYIRGPFVVEGILQGGLGALVAIVVLWIGVLVFRGRAGAVFGGAIDPASLVFLSAPSLITLLAAGMGVGAIGGLIAARSAREVADDGR